MDHFAGLDVSVKETSSLKRSTQKSSAIHKLVGRLPHLSSR